MIIGDYIVGNKTVESEHDELCLSRIVNLDLYETLQQANEDLAMPIEDDDLFCDVEWNLFHQYRDEKGFTDKDWKYVLACGYEYEQFGRFE